MTTNIDRVREFMEAMGQGINLPFSSEARKLSHDLILEELQEADFELFWRDEIDKVALTKELADLLYVTYGAGIRFGLPLQQVFEEVHRSNMSKLGDDGKPIYREDGKVMKGPNYKEADIQQFFKED